MSTAKGGVPKQVAPTGTGTKARSKETPTIVNKVVPAEQTTAPKAPKSPVRPKSPSDKPTKKNLKEDKMSHSAQKFKGGSKAAKGGAGKGGWGDVQDEIAAGMEEVGK